MSKTFAKASNYPLDWPHHFPRCAKPQNVRFSTTLFQALENVQDELRKFANDSGKKLESVIISSNYSLGDTSPTDSGVAVYFVWDAEQFCIPVDRYSLVEDNLQAIYHCIGAKRTELRHGGVTLVKAGLRGITNALPSPDSQGWREVLGYSGNSLVEAKKAYRKAISNSHSDKGGNDEQAARVNAAWEQAQKDLGQ